MADDINQLIAYVLLHRGEYGQAALWGQLVADGAAPDMVDAALAEVFGAGHGQTNAQALTAGLAADTSQAQVVAYIQANRITYNPVVLRARLLGDGIAPAQVDRAFAQVYDDDEREAARGSRPALPDPDATDGFVMFILTIINVFLTVKVLFSTMPNKLVFFIAAAELILGCVLIGVGKSGVGKGILYGLFCTVVILALLAFGLLMYLRSIFL